MNTLLEKLENSFANYFFGKNIIEMYENKKVLWMNFLESGKDLEKEFRKLGRQKIKHIVFAKVIPNFILSASVISTILTRKPMYLMGIGVSEYLRFKNTLRFQTQSLEESIHYDCERSKKYTRKIEEIVKSITSKLEQGDIKISFRRST